jgi:hypothetical protein
MYHSHLDHLTVPVYSPLHRRAWLITPRQFRLICKLNGARRFDQRSLARETGYSLHGLNRALHSLVTGGIIAVITRRGRKGWTLAQQRPGAHAMKASEANVPEQGRPPTVRVSLPGTMRGNITPTERGPTPLGALLGALG